MDHQLYFQQSVIGPLILHRQTNLEDLYSDTDKRKIIGGQSFKKVKENHSISASYEVFKKIMELSKKN